MNKKELEMREEAREAIIETLKNGYCGYYCDLHDELFNTDYYIIGTHKAKQALSEYDVWEAIEKVQTYEQDNFDKVYTDLANPEKVANMLWYIIGEEILFELMKKSQTLSDNWDNLATEKTNKQILEEIREG